MDKRFLAIITVIILAFIGYLVFSGDKTSAPSASSDAKPTNHVRGNSDSKVTFIEYGDYQCPACAQYYPVVEQVYEKYQDRVKFQFRNLPLIQIHSNAFASARAAEAADKQGKYWEMYNQLYANQTAWAEASNPNTYFEAYAKAIGLNVSQYKKDFASSAVNDAIQADLALADKLKLGSTPSFVLNDKVIKNPDPSVEAFSKVLDDALE